MHTSFIPEREFDPIANANLVVNHAEVIPNDMRINSQRFSYVAVCEPCCYQLYNGLLSRARPSIVVSKGHDFLGPSVLVDIFHHPYRNPQCGDNQHKHEDESHELKISSQEQGVQTRKVTCSKSCTNEDLVASPLVLRSRI
jgi:hypothetical protein